MAAVDAWIGFVQYGAPVATVTAAMLPVSVPKYVTPAEDTTGEALMPPAPAA